MNQLPIIIHLLSTATTALEAKAQQVRPHLRRAAIRKVNQQQADATESDLKRVLVPLFEQQIKRMATQLKGMADKEETNTQTKSTSSASSLITHAFDQKQATDEIINAVFPILAVRMAEAARNQLLLAGVDVRKKGLKFNPYHDSLGRFAIGGGVGGMAPDTGGGSGGGAGQRSVPTLEESRKKFSEYAAKIKELHKERQSLDRKNELLNKVGDPAQMDARAALAHDLTRTKNEIKLLEYKATTERMVHEAIDPAKFLQYRDKLQKDIEDWQKRDLELTDKLVDSGVRTITWYGSLSAGGVGGLDFSDIKRYKGLTPELIQECINHKNQYYDWDNPKALEHKVNTGSIKAYYGEPEKVRNITGDKLGEVSDNVSSVIPRGGASEDIKSFMSQASMLIQIKPKALDQAVSSGSLKNRFDEGKIVNNIKGGREYNKERKAAESKLFGVPSNAPASDRPIYGYLEHPDRHLSTGTEMGSNYGEVQLALKSGAKQRSTYTVGDSLDDLHRAAHAGCITDPSSHDVKPDKNKIGKSITPGLEASDWKMTEIDLDGRKSFSITPRYIEAQIFGGVKLQDIAEVRIPRNTKLASTTEKKLQKAGVTVVRTPIPYKTLYDHRIIGGWNSIDKED